MKYLSEHYFINVCIRYLVFDVYGYMNPFIIYWYNLPVVVLLIISQIITLTRNVDFRTFCIEVNHAILLLFSSTRNFVINIF